MKTLSVSLTETAFEAIEQYARSHHRSPEEVVAEAVDRWRLSPIHRPTLSSLPPLDLGKMIPTTGDDDLLEEMRSDTRY